MFIEKLSLGILGDSVQPFISTNHKDIRDIVDNNSLKVVGPAGILISNSLERFMGWIIEASLYDAGVTEINMYWFSGSNFNGTRGNNCNN